MEVSCSWWARRSRSWACLVQVQWAGGVRCGIQHWSWDTGIGSSALRDLLLDLEGFSGLGVSGEVTCHL